MSTMTTAAPAAAKARAAARHIPELKHLLGRGRLQQRRDRVGRRRLLRRYDHRAAGAGPVPVAAVIFLATWALGMAAWTWFRDQNLLNFFFFVMSAMVVLRTNTEADLGTDFSATLILLYIGAVRPGHKSKNDLPAPPPEPAPGPAYAAPARSPVYRPR